jgi:hypothetical protein
MKRILLWCSLVLAAVIALVWPMIQLPSAAARLAAIPLAGQDYHSQDMALTDADLRFLGKAKAIQRMITLKNGSRLVMTVIDGSENRHAVHDPAYCFSGGGWHIEKKSSVKVAGGEANFLRLANDKSKAEALWFFDDGGRQFISPVEYWMRTSARRATLGRSGNEPLLVTFRALSGPAVDWDRVRQILLPELGFQSGR